MKIKQMKMIKYQMQQGNGLPDAPIGCNEINLDIARKEAYNDKYVIVDMAPEEIE